MTLAGGVYQATIPAQPDGTRVDYAVTGDGRRRRRTTYQHRLLLRRRRRSRRCARSTRNGEPLYAGYAGAHSRHGHRGSGFSAGTNDDYVAGRDRRRSTSTDRPTRRRRSRRPRPDRASKRAAASASSAGGCASTSPNRSRRRRRRSASRCSPPAPAPAPLATTIAALNAATRVARRAVGLDRQRRRSSAARFPPTPQPLDAFVTVTDGTGSFSLKIDHDTDIEGFTPGGDVHADRHRPAGRFPAAVRRRLQRRAAQPRRSRRRRAGAAAAADDCRRARRRGQQRATATRRADFIPDRLGPGRQGPRHRDLDRFPRRQRHRVLHPGRDRRHRPLQHVAQRRAVRHRRQRRGDRARSRSSTA